MTKSEFKRRAESLHRQSIKVQEGMNKLLYDLEDMGVDLFAPSDAENADDITTAIQCYITYSEYNLDSIWKEIKANERLEDKK